MVGCFSKLLEAVFSAGGAVSRHGMVPGRGGGGVVGRVVRGRSGDPVMGGAHHQYYHPHPPEAPKHMVIDVKMCACCFLDRCTFVLDVFWLSFCFCFVPGTERLFRTCCGNT